MSVQKFSSLEFPNTAIGAAVPGTARVSISWRQSRQRMAGVGKSERASDKNAMPGSQDLLQPRKDRTKRVGRHHLAQDEVVAMETVVVDRREGVMISAGPR